MLQVRLVIVVNLQGQDFTSGDMEDLFSLDLEVLVQVYLHDRKLALVLLCKVDSLIVVADLLYGRNRVDV